MRNESELCTVFKNSLIVVKELGYKIPDPSGDYAKTIKRPFDLIGSWEGKLLVVECKYMSTLGSFSLQRVEDHQMEALLQWSRGIPNTQAWIVLGVNVKRGDNRVYVFKDMEEIQRRRDLKENFLKKDLEKMSHFEIHKGLIDLNLTK
ncbi:MAG: hypothetical protein WC364_12135 [Eubacteriales bacterium]|jgi:Holliday junction resolvase